MNNVLLLGNRLQYWQKVKRLFGPNLIGYWPLWETSGTVANDISGNGRNGTYTNVTLGQAGFFPGKSAAVFNGTSSFVNLFSSGLAGSFNPLEGAMLFRFKVSEAADWIDSTRRDLFYFSANGNNSVSVKKETTANVLKLEVANGGTFLSHSGDSWRGVLGWQDIALTWSKSNDRMSIYWNGELVITKSGLGVWAGTLANARIGTTTGSGNWWKGGIGDFALIDREPTANETRKYTTYASAPIRLAALGDSITGGDSSWFAITSNGYKLGRCYRINHAVAGQSIMGHMDAQTLAAANDDADIIIIALGANDNNAGDMTALQAEYAENIAELKLSNPKAAIYSLNVLPCWTNNTGATEQDKSNIRTAIAAACTAQGITCWDTYSTPWITAADTSDGVHPTAAGHAKIATEVLARI